MGNFLHCIYILHLKYFFMFNIMSNVMQKFETYLIVNPIWFLNINLI